MLELSFLLDKMSNLTSAMHLFHKSFVMVFPVFIQSLLCLLAMASYIALSVLMSNTLIYIDESDLSGRLSTSIVYTSVPVLLVFCCKQLYLTVYSYNMASCVYLLDIKHVHVVSKFIYIPYHKYRAVVLS